MNTQNVVFVDFRNPKEALRHNAWILLLLDQLADHCATNGMQIASNAIEDAIQMAETDILTAPCSRTKQNC